MSNEIAVAGTGALEVQMAYADRLADSSLVPNDYRGKPANILVALGYADALGLAPMIALQQINIISGKPAMSAQLMAALTRRAGHKLRVLKQESGVWAKVIRSDDPESEFTAHWDLARAKAAGYLNKPGQWKSDPLLMCKWRAISEVVREACPEVLAGAYLPDELDWSAPPSTAPTAPVVNTSHLMDAMPLGANGEQVDVVTGEVVDAEVMDPEEQ